ncbi:DUF3800 domain-containing protein [Methylomonas sp. DH-1]|uniref:DUF3800 domain-containing protein n=1 Tax=Methylomonas sp. (strain DH-1) TaxID=1727196 RepID=UPI0007C8C6C4|nr:DUF3800 domain-containing protein [Methylomonas sp. DH-1]ANE53750.1 hypothetical protein AYM39_00190 [Methylomonas sp. DH-1]
MTKVVAFDESGNTGTDLLNFDQPVFVLASCDFTVDEAELLLQKLSNHQTREIKLSRIKRSISGRKQILNFLSDSALEKERVRVFYYHKKFMAVTKIVDILVETLAHRDGIDLYKKGGNIALSNLYYYCIPILCGEDLFNKMLLAFIAMISRLVKNHILATNLAIRSLYLVLNQSCSTKYRSDWLQKRVFHQPVREPSDISIRNFYVIVSSLYRKCIGTEYEQIFMPIIASNEIVEEVLNQNSTLALDPAIPALFHLLTEWGEQYAEGFKILHDDSKPIACEKDMLEALMDLNGPYRKIGYDRRKAEFPIRSDGIEFRDSKTDSRLQVADLISGSCNHWARGLADGRYRDDFWSELNCLGMTKFSTYPVWPSVAVTPEQLGTQDESGVNAMDAMARYVFERAKKSKSDNPKI